MPVFTVTTLGCKVNQYESNAVASMLRGAGWSRAPRDAPADLVVINTCVVTTTGMRKSRQAIRRAVRNAPDATVLVIGCYNDYDLERVRTLLSAMNVPQERQFLAGHHGDVAATVHRCIRQTRSSAAFGVVNRQEASLTPPASGGPGMFLHTPNGQTRSLTYSSHLDCSQGHAGGQDPPLENPGTRDLPSIDRFEGHQRAFVKIQDGCDAACTYCIVTRNRPVVRSRPRDKILAECRRLVEAGHREIVLCGVFLGAYGRPTARRRRWDDAPSALPELLADVAELPGLWRVRLSSLEPGDVTDELLAVYRDVPAVAPHLHLPLQSGSQRILRRMNRQYTTEAYVEVVDRLRQTLDRPALSTDVIAGFPGETDEDWQATLTLARHAGFCKVHAFPFSAIPGTPAYDWRSDCPPRGLVKSRLAELAEIERQTAQAYRQRFVGQTLTGLVEETRPGPGQRQAMTDRYLTVTFTADGDGDDWTGRVVRLRVTGVTEDGLVGQIADEAAP